MSPAPRLIAALTAAALFRAGAALAAGDLGGVPEELRITPGDGLVVDVPSGQSVTLLDVVWNVPGPDGLTTRFRFLTPAIAPGGGVDFDTASADMQHLCDAFALPRVKDNVPAPSQIVVSFSDRPLPFGASDPEVTQFFEAYRIEGGACEWEMF